MRITTRHPASAHGVPIILDEAGKPMRVHEGVRAALDVLGWSRQDLAEASGVSLRTVEGWLSSGKTIPVNVLNVLADALAGK
jgi:hypothetical protein